MADYEERLSALIEEISVAFQGVSRENGVSLSESWVIDNYGSDEECAAARAEDKDTRWQDVPDKDIYDGYSCLRFLDDIGFRYYIPAYMVWTMKNYSTSDSNTVDFTVFALIPSGDQQMRNWSLNLFCIFTCEQAKAIAHFLQFIAEYDTYGNAQHALDSYWGKFT